MIHCLVVELLLLLIKMLVLVITLIQPQDRSALTKEYLHLHCFGARSILRLVKIDVFAIFVKIFD